MQYKIKSNPMNPLCCALLVPDCPKLRITWLWYVGRYYYASPSCRITPNRRTFMHASLYLYGTIAVTVFDGVGLSGFKSRVNDSLLSTYIERSLFFFLWVGFWIWVIPVSYPEWSHRQCFGLVLWSTSFDPWRLPTHLWWRTCTVHGALIV